MQKRTKTALIETFLFSLSFLFSMRLYHCDKLVLRASPNPASLLNGITTNVLGAPQTAFLDVFGKIVVIADQVRVKDDVLLVIERQFLQRFKKHIHQYLLLCDAKLTEEHFFVYWNLDQDYEAGGDEYIIPQKAGQLVLSPDDLACSISDEEFTRFRLKHNLPLQGKDFDQEMALNVGESFISFTKGCFLGQEVIARVKSRSKPPKKLIVVNDIQCTPDQKKQMTSVSLNPSTGVKQGFLFVGD